MTDERFSIFRRKVIIVDVARRNFSGVRRAFA